MEFKIAELSDIDATLALHGKYQLATIKEEDKKDGFVTTAFTKAQLTDLINQEKGLFIAKQGDQVMAYAMAASWQFWSIWPMFAHMVKDLPNLTYLDQKLSVDNSYQYGPICIDKSLRSTDLLFDLFNFSRVEMAKRFPILVTFINKINPRSYVAHTKKLGLEVIQEFEYNNNHYYELVYDTSKSVSAQKIDE